MDINIPSDFVTAMASSTTSNMAGVSYFIALLLGLILVFYILEVLVDLIYYKHEEDNTNTTAN